ncbi:MAG: hypothetical protein PHS37_08010 [Candidatus Omnitrophica bacterium]|nr:hypothetical protein [Candidatus Omnitrophota bacterium]
MLRILRTHSPLFGLVKVSLGIFLLVYSADVLSLAPVSKFISWNMTDKTEFITYYVTLFSVLYLSSLKITDTKEYRRAKEVLVRLNNTLVKNGITLTIKNVEYIKSQPGVIYCTFKIGETIRVVRVFDTAMRSCVYPAKILYETSFKSIGKVVQVITNNSYDIIGIGEEKVIKTPYTSFDRYTGILSSVVMRFLSYSFMAYNVYMLLAHTHFFAPLPLIASVTSFLLIGFMYDKSRDIKTLARAFFPGTYTALLSGICEPAIDALKKISGETSYTGRQKIVAIETDWLSLIYTNAQIAGLLAALREKYNGRIKIIFNSSPVLFSDIMREVQESGLSPADTVLIGSARNETILGSRWLKGKGSVCITIDTAGMEKARKALNAHQHLYVDVIEILENALRIAEKGDVSESRYLRIIYEPAIDPLYAVFSLYPRILDKNMMPLIYKKQLEIISSA